MIVPIFFSRGQQLLGPEYICTYRSAASEVAAVYSASTPPDEDLDYVCMSLSPIDRGADGVFSPCTLVRTGFGPVTFCRQPSCNTGPPPETTQAVHVRLPKPLSVQGGELLTAGGLLLTLPPGTAISSVPADIAAWLDAFDGGSSVPIHGTVRPQSNAAGSPPALFHLYQINSTLYESAILPVGTYVVIPIQ